MACLKAPILSYSAKPFAAGMAFYAHEALSFGDIKPISFDFIGIGGDYLLSYYIIFFSSCQ